MIKPSSMTSFPHVLRGLERTSWVICEAFLCIIGNISKALFLAFLTISPDFNITETSIQTNFDSEAHEFLS